MSDPISTFFDAWRLEDSDERLKQITSAVHSDVEYDDPRTPETVRGIEALNDYVGMFTANAPGWSASVVESDTRNSISRATVAFGGMGPDGSEMRQLGQYFIETDGDLIVRMVGFVGTGAQE